MSAPRDPIVDVSQRCRYVLTEAATASPPLTPREHRVLAAAVAFLAGWSRTDDVVTLHQLGQACGLAKDGDRRNLERAVRSLARRELLAYTPGDSPRGGRRIASKLGLPPVPAGWIDPTHPRSVPTPGTNPDPRSESTPGRDDDPRSFPAPTPGRSRHRPPVSPDPPPEEFPEESPESAHAREAPATPDQLATAIGEAVTGSTSKLARLLVDEHHTTLAALAGAGWTTDDVRSSAKRLQETQAITRSPRGWVVTVLLPTLRMGTPPSVSRRRHDQAAQSLAERTAAEELAAQEADRLHQARLKLLDRLSPDDREQLLHQAEAIERERRSIAPGARVPRRLIIERAAFLAADDGRREVPA